MVHVQDLNNIYLRLVKEAVKGSRNATWGPEGYYFAEIGEFVWGDMAKAIAKDAHKTKLIPTAKIDNITPEEADKLISYGSYFWGIVNLTRISLYLNSVTDPLTRSPTQSTTCIYSLIFFIDQSLHEFFFSDICARTDDRQE